MLIMGLRGHANMAEKESTDGLWHSIPGLEQSSVGNNKREE